MDDACSAHYVAVESEFIEGRQRDMEWVNQVGQWPNIFPPAWIHKVLDEKEFRDNLILRYQAQTKEIV